MVAVSLSAANELFICATAVVAERWGREEAPPCDRLLVDAGGGEGGRGRRGGGGGATAAIDAAEAVGGEEAAFATSCRMDRVIATRRGGASGSVFTFSGGNDDDNGGGDGDTSTGGGAKADGSGGYKSYSCTLPATLAPGDSDASSPPSPSPRRLADDDVATARRARGPEASNRASKRATCDASAHCGCGSAYLQADQ